MPADHIMKGAKQSALTHFGATFFCIRNPAVLSVRTSPARVANPCHPWRSCPFGRRQHGLEARVTLEGCPHRRYTRPYNVRPLGAYTHRFLLEETARETDREVRRRRRPVVHRRPFRGRRTG